MTARIRSLAALFDSAHRRSVSLVKALRAFQEAFRLGPTGVLDDATRARLFDAHEKSR